MPFSTREEAAPLEAFGAFFLSILMIILITIGVGIAREMTGRSLTSNPGAGYQLSPIAWAFIIGCWAFEILSKKGLSREPKEVLVAGAATGAAFLVSPIIGAAITSYMLTWPPADDEGIDRIGGETHRNPDSKAHETEELVNAYGAVLERDRGYIAIDESDLPCSKEKLKRVICDAYHLTGNEYLKAGFVELAQYQPGVGSVRIQLVDDASRDIIQDGGDPIELARAISQTGSLVSQWQPIVEAERAALRMESDLW